MNYWYTSALLKLYVLERDSTYFRALATNSVEPIITSDIAREEVLCALYRKEHEANLKVGGAAKLFQSFQADSSNGRIVMVPKGKDVLSQVELLLSRAYSQKPPLFIRSLDAVHIASALSIKAKSIVATDKRLRDVATLMGFALLPK